VGYAHNDMLDLAVRLAQREAAGFALSPPERALSDIMWIGCQVSPNGLDGWLAYTSCERMRSTLAALREVGAPDVADLLGEALTLAGVDPEQMSDERRESQIDSLNEEDRGRLSS
jgi:hypothetical protein